MGCLLFFKLLLSWFFFESKLIQAEDIKALNRSEKSNHVLRLTSSAFGYGDLIAKRYSCEGEDVSPPLAWKNVQAGVRSFALICDDPDAPMGNWIHWVVFDIPATVNSLPERVDLTTIPAKNGLGSWGVKKEGYGGPCPPFGEHRYIFTLYALDIETVGLPVHATKEELLKKMEGHIMATGELVGTYRKEGRS